MPISYQSAFTKLNVLNHPALSDALIRIRVPDQTYARAELTVPLSPAEAFADTTWFEQPADSGQKLYLPRYKPATAQTAGGQEQYRIRLEERAPGWMLQLQLLPYPAQELELAARDASVLPHRVSVLLRYTLGTGGIQKELPFEEVTVKPDGVQAVLQLASLAERDELYGALTEPQASAVLLVRRELQAAVPVPTPEAAQPKTGPFKPVKPFPLHIVQPAQPVQPIQPAQPVQPVQPMKLSTSVQSARLLQSLSVRKTGGTARPLPAINRESTIRLNPDLIKVIGGVQVQTPAEPPQVRYRIVTRTLDVQLPFYFPARLHGYIFGGIEPAYGRPNLIRHQVRFGSDFFSYYQETSRSYLFYYLPDAFKLARLPVAPYLPFMSARFASEDGSLGTSRATLEYAAAPYVNPARLEDAAQALKGQVDGTLPEGITGPVFQPLLADAKRLKYRLALPNAAGPFQLRDGAIVNLKEGIVDALSLSIQELQLVFEALMGSGTAPLLMTGEVEVSLDDDQQQVAEKVPFTARMDDLAGELFEARYTPDPASGGVQIALRNAIESPVRIDRLHVRLERGGQEVPAVLQRLTLPVERLAPGEELVFAAAPSEPAAAPEGEPLAAELLLQPGDAAVLPDREAIWSAIQDPFTAQYEQGITIKTLPAIFNLAPGRPEEERLSEMVVELRQGGADVAAVVLNAETPEVRIAVPFPIADVLLRRETTGQYEYRVTAIRLAGETQREWKPKTGALLYILQGDVG